MKISIGRLSAAARGLFKQFGRNSIGALVSQLILMGTGLVTVYVLTQKLGRSDYGNYATAIALVYVSAPLLELGSNHLLARGVATDEEPARLWGMAVTVHVLGALFGALALWLIQPVILPEVPRAVVALLAISELVGPALVAGAVLAFEADGRSSIGARLRVVTTVAKLIALAILVALSEPTLIIWCAMQLGAALVSGVLTVRFVRRELGLSASLRLPSRAETKTGLAFTASQVAHTGQKDADKVIMGYFSLNGEAADYTAGYRFVSLGLIPLKGILSGTYGQFFRSGAESTASVLRLALRLTSLALVLLAPVTIGLFLGADLLPRILGAEFEEAADVVRLLSVIPLLKALQGFANNALVGAGFHGKRVGAVVGTLVLNIGLNLLWVPEYGWRGAAWATLIVEVILALILWFSLFRAARGSSSTAAVDLPDAHGPVNR